MSAVGQNRDGERSGVSRRDFLRVGGLSVVGLSVAERAALAQNRAATDCRSCIFVLMTGGPSQFETFDPKPEAPSEIRGPLRAISTAVPGTQLSESLPRLAERAGRFAIVRSLHHDAAPIHEVGHQLLQTGRLAHGSVRHPSYGSVVAHLLGPRDDIVPYAVISGLLGDTGVNAYRGQQAGFLGSDFDPWTSAVGDGHDGASPADGSDGSDPLLPHSFLQDESESVRREYGETRFGRLCLQARQMVESGVRCVTVNLFESLVNQTTWDCHGRTHGAPADLYDYRDTLCPEFDRAFATLLDDLQQRGLLDETLVIAVGEFGRTPRINDLGGRDHWPGVWSALVAGCGIQGGQVLGASDAHGTAPIERPVAPAELTATIYERLGLDLDLPLAVDEQTELPISADRPITELLG